MTMPQGNPGHIEEFPLVGGALNLRGSRARLKRGELSLAIGVDGRTIGGLSKYPGFELFRDLGLTGVTWFREVSVRIGVTDDMTRGWLVHHVAAGVHYITYFYYNGATGTWGSFDTGFTTLASTDVCSADGNDRFVYIGVRGHQPRVIWNDGFAFRSDVMGLPVAYYTPSVVSGVPNVAGGHLADGSYLVGFRYYDQVRRRFSAMSTLQVATALGGSAQSITVSSTGGELPFTDGFSHVYIYRSLSADVAGTPFNAGALFEESQVTLVADAWTASAGTLYDNSLVSQPCYDPNTEEAGLPPETGELAVYENMTFTGSTPDVGQPIPVVRFSPLTDTLPETFPSTAGYSYSWATEDGPTRAFCRAGDLLYVWTRNSAIRIAKLGPQLTMFRLHGGRGLIARGGITAVGRDMLVMTGSGLMLVDGEAGNMQAVGQLNKLFTSASMWAGSLHTVFAATDSKLGVSYFVNPTTRDALLIWHLTGAITQLNDVDFVWACEGPDPTAMTDAQDDQRRAWFITSTGKIFYTPLTGTHDSMWGLDSAAVTVNGTLTGGTATSLTMIGAAGWTTALLAGATVYVWNPTDLTSAPQKARITTVSGVGNITLNLDAALAPVPGANWYFSIAPVPFHVRTWPMAHDDPNLADFGRRVGELTALSVTGYTGATSAVTARWRVGFYRNFDDGVTHGEAFAAWVTPENRGRYVATAADGYSLEPFVEQIGAGMNFELLSVLVNGRIDTTTQVGG